MGLRGPKKLSAAELRQRGSRLHLIKEREQEEQSARRRTTIGAKRAVGAVPKSLTHAKAIAFWRQSMGDYDVDAHTAILLEEAALCLQRAEKAREVLDTEGETYTDAHGKRFASPLVKIELDYRQLFARLFQQLGFLAE